MAEGAQIGQGFWVSRHRPKPIRMAIAVLGILHAVGLAGLQWPLTQHLFHLLTPWHLLLTAGALLAFQKEYNGGFWAFAALAAIGGFAVEVIGVHTGYLFGTYHYGETLGSKWMGVPLTIALNWFVLAYTIHCISYGWLMNKWGRATLAALLMMALDVFIEPVAIRHDFWHWQQGLPGIHNYIGWFGVSWVLFCAGNELNFNRAHPLVMAVFVMQLLFFLLQCCLIVALQ